MALFIFIGHDVADSINKRQTTRPKHLSRLADLQSEGRLHFAGFMPSEHCLPPYPCITGSAIIADFVDIDVARAWADAEPYLLEGVYSHIEVRPLVQVLP